MKRLNKKYKYRLGICGMCEKPILAREQTQKEWKKYSKTLGNDSVSKFKQTMLINVKRFCECPLECTISVPYSYKKADELFNKIDN